MPPLAFIVRLRLPFSKNDTWSLDVFNRPKTYHEIVFYKQWLPQEVIEFVENDSVYEDSVKALANYSSKPYARPENTPLKNIV